MARLSPDEKAELELVSLIGKTQAFVTVNHFGFLIFRGSNNNIYALRGAGLYNLTKGRRLCVSIVGPKLLPFVDYIMIKYLWIVNQAEQVEIIANQMEYLDAYWVKFFVKEERVLDKTMSGTTMIDILQLVTKGTGIKLEDLNGKK